jgi:hypothetical protein
MDFQVVEVLRGLKHKFARIQCPGDMPCAFTGNTIDVLNHVVQCKNVHMTAPGENDTGNYIVRLNTQGYASQIRTEAEISWPAIVFKPRNLANLIILLKIIKEREQWKFYIARMSRVEDVKVHVKLSIQDVSQCKTTHEVFITKPNEYSLSIEDAAKQRTVLAVNNDFVRGLPHSTNNDNTTSLFMCVINCEIA